MNSFNYKSDTNPVALIIVVIAMVLFGLIILAKGDKTETQGNVLRYEDNCDTVVDRNGAAHDVCDNSGWYQHFVNDAEKEQELWDKHIEDLEDQARAEAMADRYYEDLCREHYGDC